MPPRRRLPLPDRQLRRQPYQHEVAAAVNFAQIDKNWQSQADSLVEHWTSVIRAGQIAELQAAIEEAAGDLEQLAGSPPPCRRRDDRDASASMASLGAAEAVGEAARQGVAAAQPDIADLEAELGARAAALAQLLAQALSQAAATKAVQLSGGNLTPSEVAGQVGDYIDGLSDAYLQDQFGGALSAAQNAGRLAAMSENGASRYYASELLDTNTCEPCSSIDGTEYASADAAGADYPAGGYRDCQAAPAAAAPSSPSTPTRPPAPTVQRSHASRRASTRSPRRSNGRSRCTCTTPARSRSRSHAHVHCSSRPSSRSSSASRRARSQATSTSTSPRRHARAGRARRAAADGALEVTYDEERTMADGVFNVAKGRVAEKVADGSALLGDLLIKTAEADTALRDRTTLADILGGNTEANFTNYARKTAITGTVTVDQANDRVDVDIPDQTWTTAGGAVNNTLAKLIVFYEEAAADATRIPLTHHDFVVTTDGSDLAAQIAAAGFYRAA
jgi:hypothetical protein